MHLSTRHGFSFSRHRSPEFCNHVRASEERGRRECRVSDAPVAAQNAVVVHRFTGLNRHSLRDGFTASFVLSPVTGLIATVASVMRSTIANLTPASGRQDHTTSPYASRAVRLRAVCVHRSPRPTLMTMANAPLAGTGYAIEPVICPRDQQQ
jgi:hypothetical protein